MPKHPQANATIVSMDDLIRSDFFESAVSAIAAARGKRNDAAQLRRQLAEAMRDRAPVTLPSDEREQWVRRAMEIIHREARLRAGPEPCTVAEGITDELNQAVCRQYPTPIAKCFHRYWNEADGSATQKFHALLDTVESFLQMVGTLVLGRRTLHDSSESVGSERSASLDKAIVDAVLRPRPSMGDLVALVDAGTKWLAELGGQGIAEQLAVDLQGGRRGRAPIDALWGFVGLRNKHSGHARGRLEERFARLLDPCENDLALVLRAAAPLAKGMLLRPLEIDDKDGRVLQAMVHRGTDKMKWKRLDPPLVIRKADRDPGGLARAERFLWVDEPGASVPYLPLYPLASLAPTEVEQRSDILHFLCATDWDGGRLKAAELDTYETSLEPLKVADGANATDGTRELLRMIEARVRLVRPAALLPSERQPALADPRETYDLPGVRAEQRYHHERFVGRVKLVEELSNRDVSGHLLLLGAAGAGKSALVSEVFDRLRSSGRPAVLHMVKAEREPDVFLRFMLAQLSKLRADAGLTPIEPRTFEGTPAAIKASFWREASALVATAGWNGGLWVLMDGLDELSEELMGDPWFLEPVVPDGVRVLLASRPEAPLVPTLRQRIKHVRTLVLDSGLDEEEVEHVIVSSIARAKARPAPRPRELAREVHAATGGNPLFVSFAVDSILEDARADWIDRRQGARFPAGAGELAWLQHTYARATGRLGVARDDGARLRERALWILSVMHGRAMLELDAIQGVANASGMSVFRSDLLEHLGRMKGLLTQDNVGRYGAFHKRLADYVCEEALSAEDRRQVHGWVVSWMEAEDGGVERVAAWSDYDLEHRVWHLLSAGRTSDAERLLTSPGYLTARLDARGVGTVSGIQADYRTAAAAGQASAEIADWELFWRESSHAVRRGAVGWPASRVFLQRALDYATSSPVTRAVEEWLSARAQPPPVARKVNRSGLRPRSGCLRIIEGHSLPIRAAALHADGRRVVTASFDHTVRVWDLETGERLRTHSFPLGSPLELEILLDGRRVAIAGERGIEIWDLDSGETSAQCEYPRGGSEAVIALHPDGKHVVVAAWFEPVRVYDVEDGRCVAALGKVDKRHPQWIAVGRDGRQAAIKHDDGRVALWDLETGKMLIDRTLNPLTIGVDPNGNWVAASCAHTTLRIWDVRTGACLRIIDTAPPRVSAAALHPDGKRILLAAECLWVRDLQGDGCVRGTERLSSRVSWVTVLPGGARALTTTGEEGTVKVFDVQTAECVGTLSGHCRRIRAMRAHPSGRLAITAGDDGTVRAWNLTAFDAIAVGDVRHKTPVLAVCIVSSRKKGLSVSVHPDEARFLNRIYRSSRPFNFFRSRRGEHNTRREVRLWDLETGTHLQTVATKHPAWFHPSGLMSSYSSRDSLLFIHDITTDEQRLQGSQDSLSVTAVDREGRRAASGDDEGTVRLWDLSRGECIVSFKAHDGPVTAICFQGAGRLGVSMEEGGPVRVWEADTGLTRVALSAEQTTALAFHPDGSHVVCACEDGTIGIWDIVTRRVVRSLRSHEEGVSSIAMSADGSRVLTAGMDRIARLWSYHSGELLWQLDGDHGWTACDLDEAGHTVMLGDEGGNVVLMRLTF